WERPGRSSATNTKLAADDSGMGVPHKCAERDAIIAVDGQIQHVFGGRDGYSLDGRAREVTDGLGFSQEMMDGAVGALSGGWKMRVALARILLMRPDALLLHDPSNHLDLESLISLEAFLHNHSPPMFITSPALDFLHRLCPT
ncbi:glycosyl transferase family 1, partial [Devosia limi DSM 17137]